MRQGRQQEQLGQPDPAEERFLQALKALEELLALEDRPEYAAAAADCCTSLADLCMQQGNMHGADFYYARAMGYGQGLRFPPKASGRK